MASCILYQNDSVTILDIPRSLEQAQGVDFTRNIISSAPLHNPYPSVEPKSGKAKANLGTPSIEELLLEKYIELVLQDVQKNHQGPWCLPRTTAREEGNHEDLHPRKRKKRNLGHKEDEDCEEKRSKQEDMEIEGPLFQNPGTSPLYLTSSKRSIYLPPNSTALQGDISDTLGLLENSAPKFNLILLDPPWPNRSARRKGSYGLSYSAPDIRALLSSIPIEDHLEDEGLVGVWITNKPAFRSMLLEKDGLFDLWNIELVEEWVWLKITEHGEPICKLDSMWRKPYEILLVGRKKSERNVNKSSGEMGNQDGEGGKRRFIIGVPDLHSRKPNLKTAFGKVIGNKDFKGLEIFARNLTEEWWSWGNEVLKFQGEEHWVPAYPSQAS